MQCGKPLDTEEEYCLDCSKEKHLYLRGRSALCYEGDAKEAIHKIKYENKRAYIGPLAELMAERLAGDVRRWDPQVLIPVPMTENKRKSRGFNQAEILARHLGRVWGIPVDTQLLVKLVDTGEQKKLDKRMRRRNLRNAFEARENGKYTRVLLIDDVYTTGSTVDAAAGALHEAGITEVFYAAVCIGYGSS